MHRIFHNEIALGKYLWNAPARLLFWSAVLFLIVCGALPAAASGSAFNVIDRATLVIQGASSEVGLPHVLPLKIEAGQGAYVRYELLLDLPERPAQASALLIEKMSLSGRVTVNNYDIGGCGQGSLGLLRCLHQPIFLQIAPEILKAGKNEIQIDLFVNGNQPNGLSSVVFGPADVIYEKEFRWRHFWKYEVVLALAWATATLGVVFLLVSLILRSTPLYFSFGLAALANSLCAINPLTNHIWVNLWWDSWFIYSIRLVSGPLVLVSLMEFYRVEWPFFKKFLIAYIFVGPALIALADNSRDVVIIAYIPMLVAALLLAAKILPRALMSSSRAEMGIGIILSLSLVVAVRDYMVLQGRAAFTSSYLFSYTNALAIFIMGAVIVRFLAEALHSSEQLNDALSDEIGAYRASLLDKHRIIVALERDNVREALLREMHDGLGSSLAIAKIRLADEQITRRELSELLDDCIDGLRLILDSMVPDEELQFTLGKLRRRFTSRLQAAGVAVEWRIELDDVRVPPGDQLNVLRIIQEALINVVRHANASRVRIEAVKSQQSELLVKIEDNGKGLSREVSETGGRGLPNMRARAEALHAFFEISSSGKGTTVFLRMPVFASHEAR